MISSSVTYLNILAMSLVVCFWFLCFYIQHIIHKWVVSKTVANIIVIPTSFIILSGIYLAIKSQWISYNLPLLIQHTLMCIPIIVLSTIGILRKK